MRPAFPFPPLTLREAAKSLAIDALVCTLLTFDRCRAARGHAASRFLDGF